MRPRPATLAATPSARPGLLAMALLASVVLVLVATPAQASAGCRRDRPVRA